MLNLRVHFDGRSDLVEHYKAVRARIASAADARVRVIIAEIVEAPQIEAEPPPPAPPPEAYEIPVLSRDFVIREVAKAYGIPVAVLKGKTRSGPIVRVRQIAAYLAMRLVANTSFPSVGRALNRDHTTILHAFRKIGALMEADLTVREEIDQLAQAIRLRAVKIGAVT